MVTVEPSGCWIVEGLSGEVLRVLLGKMSEVIPAAREVEGFYVEGRSGRTVKVTIAEACRRRPLRCRALTG